MGGKEKHAPKADLATVIAGLPGSTLSARQFE
jgi:hypothetical protein